MIGTTSAVAELGTVLGIWAHPDDEAYLSGGLMAMARDNGSRVVCVTATRGELGTPDPVVKRPGCGGGSDPTGRWSPARGPQRQPHHHDHPADTQPNGNQGPGTGRATHPAPVHLSTFGDSLPVASHAHS